jgi:formyltetrahydrofolate deformylase
VAGIANFLYSHNANILHADQHQDEKLGLFFMRVEWDLEKFDLTQADFAPAFEPVARPLQLQWSLHYSHERPEIALFVSKYLHCMADLLHRHHVGELNGRIALIMSNHMDGRRLAEFYEVPYHYLPIEADSKSRVEQTQLELLAKHSIELVVLARYMQVLSPGFVAAYPQRIINVHHSFLPAFTGPKPYHAAAERGVKLIGATAHYVTDILDDGPIIEQDVGRISHRHNLDDLIETGRDLERLVLSRAVRWHLERRVLCYANKTVVF